LIPDGSGIFFILLGANDVPRVIAQVVNDQWFLLEDTSCHWDIPYDLNFTPSIDGGGTGYAWTNHDYDFSVDALGDNGEPPTEEEAQAVYLLFLERLAELGEIDTQEDLDEEVGSDIQVAFCCRPIQ
jgi:hypothetical protein